LIITVSLFGFGDDRPAAFGNSDYLDLTMQGSETIAVAIDRSGLKETEGIATMLNGKLVQSGDWDTTTMYDGDTLKILLAIEGG